MRVENWIGYCLEGIPSLELVTQRCEQEGTMMFGLIPRERADVAQMQRWLREIPLPRGGKANVSCFQGTDKGMVVGRMTCFVPPWAIRPIAIVEIYPSRSLAEQMEGLVPWPEWEEAMKDDGRLL